MYVQLTDQDREQLQQISDKYMQMISGENIENQRPLIEEYAEVVNSFHEQIERREFAKFGGDREKIIQSAEEQLHMMIDDRYDYSERMMKSKESDLFRSKKVETVDLKIIAYDLRIDGNDFYLDVDTLIQESKTDPLGLYYEALKNDPEAIKRLDDLVVTIISNSPKTSRDKGVLVGLDGLGKQKKSRSKKIIPVYSPDIVQNFFMFATTPAKDVLYDLFSNNGDVNETAKNINTIRKKKSAKKLEKEEGRAIQVESENSKTIIEILNSSCQKVNSRPAKKILHFIESELYQRIYSKGKLHDNIVSFPLQKMVDKGLYSSTISARKAFYDASNVMTALRVSAMLKSGKKEITMNEGNARVVLFPTMSVDNNQCMVRLNQDINWTPLLKDFFLMPDSWWGLSDNASDLEYKIFRAIRLNKDDIESDGSLTFNISLNTVANWLKLPLNTKNPKHNVKDPIESAVAQIAESLDKKNFEIQIIAENKSTLTHYLTGYLKITVSGLYTQNLINLNEKQRAIIEKEVQKKEEIIKEASIRKLTQQMIDDEKNSSQLK